MIMISIGYREIKVQYCASVLASGSSEGERIELYFKIMSIYKKEILNKQTWKNINQS